MNTLRSTIVKIFPLKSFVWCFMILTLASCANQSPSILLGAEADIEAEQWV